MRAFVLDALTAAPRYLNPAIALSLQLEAERIENPEDVFRHEGRIQQAIDGAEKEIKRTARVVDALKRATPVPADVTPEGF